MNSGFVWVLALMGAVPASGELLISSCSRSGDLTVAGTFTNGVCTLRRAEAIEGVWSAAKNVFTTSTVAVAGMTVTGQTSFYRAEALDLSGGRSGFTNFTRAYGLLTTLAGNGTGPQENNNWRPEYEGRPATNVALSGPHMAMTDRGAGIYIADKDAHAIRKVRPDGTLVTAAGVNAPGDGPDEETPATESALNQPNGLWVNPDGTVFILDLGNSKIRRLSTNGTVRTLFAVTTGETIQRGLWVSADETLAYVTTYTSVKRWTRDGGVSDFSTGYVQMGNIVVDPWGSLVVTDRGAHRVYRLDSQGLPTPIAGNGGTTGGGDGQPALATGLNEVRGVWFLPTGAYLLCTHRGSQVWYVDTDGIIHFLLNGDRFGSHAGDGTWFYNPGELRVSKCRAVTADPEGNILITENDYGYVRKVRFLPCDP
jgi:streptogramin lyase